MSRLTLSLLTAATLAATSALAATAAATVAIVGQSPAAWKTPADATYQLRCA